MIANRFIRSYSFTSPAELSYFLKKQGSIRELWLDDSIGNYYICYLFCDSLTQKPMFSITFSTDKSEAELNLLFWSGSKLIVLETDNKIYLINEELYIIASIDLMSPVVGLYITPGNSLLLLEETILRLIDFEGKTVMMESFDLIEDFDIDGNVLNIQTAEKKLRFNLKGRL